MAEQLLPVINLATWKDRASVARAAGKDVPLRELRSIVASSSTVTLDEEGSEMATALRTSLTERVTALRERWIERITGALDEGRVVDAVRASIRPPEPAARLTAELAVRLADAAGQAMSAETPPAEWLALLEVVVDSPVRRTVKPAGLPGRGRRGAAGRRPQGVGLRARAGPADGDPHPPAARSPSTGAGPVRLRAAGPPDRRPGAPATAPPSRLAVHGEQPRLEARRLVEVLRPPVAGQGGAVHPPAPSLLQPGHRGVQQEPAQPHSPRPGLDVAGVEHARAGLGGPLSSTWQTPKPVTTSSRVPTRHQGRRVGQKSVQPATGPIGRPGAVGRATSSAPPVGRSRRPSAPGPSPAVGARRRRWPVARPPSASRRPPGRRRRA